MLNGKLRLKIKVLYLVLSFLVFLFVCAPAYSIQKVERTENTQADWQNSFDSSQVVTDGNDLTVESDTIQVESGKFLTPASNTSRTVNGLGFKPDVIRFKITSTHSVFGAETEFSGNRWGWGHGLADCTKSPCKERSLTVGSGSNSTDGQVTAGSDTSAVFQVLTDTDGEPAGQRIMGNIASTNNDGFTVQFDATDDTNYVVWTAYNFGDSSQVQVDHIQTPTSTGNQSVSMGFQPDYVNMISQPRITTINTKAEEVDGDPFDNGWGHGWGVQRRDGSIEQRALAVSMEGQDINNHVFGSSDQDILYILRTTGGGVSSRIQASLDSFNSNGFTLNYSSVDNGQIALYLAVKNPGPQTVDHTLTAQSTGNQTISTAVEPDFLEFMANNTIPSMNTEQFSGDNRSDNHHGWMFGSGQTDTQLAMGFSSHSNSVNGHASGSSDTSVLHLLYSDVNGNILGRDQASITSLNSNSFDLNYTSVATQLTNGDIKYDDVILAHNAYDTDFRLASGERTSPPLSVGDITDVAASQIQWTSAEPVNTTITVQTALNSDSTTEPPDASFQTASNGNSIPGVSEGDDLSGQVLWIRQSLSSNSGEAPRLNSLFVQVKQDSGVTITEPNDKHETSSSPITVKGIGKNALKGDSVVLLRNGLAVDTVSVQADSSWQASITLNTGKNEIRSELKNGDPTSTTTDQDTITVTLDDIPPDLRINNPAAGDTTTQFSINVSGTVGQDAAIADDVKVRNRDKGSTVTTSVQSDSSWTASNIPLELGFNTILARLTDKFGNVAKDTVLVKVVSGNDGPVVQFINPADGAFVSGTVSVQVEASDPNGLDHVDFYRNRPTVGLNDGGAITINYDESFSNVPIVLAQIQENNGQQIVVQAVNVNQNSFDLYFCGLDTSNPDGCGTVNDPMKIGWVAIDPANNPFSSADLGGQSEDVFSNLWDTPSHTVGSVPSVTTMIQTNNGGQQHKPSMVRNVTASDFDYRFCEHEPPGDNCNTHNSENVGWFAFSTGVFNDGSGGDDGEADTVLAQPDGQWDTVSYSGNWSNPIALATSNSENGPESPKVAHTRGLLVDRPQFEARLCEHEDGGGCDVHNNREDIGWQIFDVEQLQSIPNADAGIVGFHGLDIADGDSVFEVKFNTKKFTDGSNYTFDATAYDSAGAINRANNIQVTVDNSPPTDFNLLSPLDGIGTKVQPVTFDWQDSSDTLSGLKDYFIEVSLNSSFTSTEFSGFTNGATSDTSLNLDAGDTYFWRVFARDEAGNTTGFTAADSFIVDRTDPDPVSLLKPENGTVTNAISIIFDWTKSQDTGAGIRNYHIQLDTGPNVNLSDGLVFEGDTTTTDIRLSPGSSDTFVWRVFARDQATNTSGYSSEDTFIVDRINPPRVTDLNSTATVDPPDTGVHLSWTFSSGDVEFFRIYRSFQTVDTSLAVEIDTTGLQPDTITYRDSTVTRGDSYFYYVTALDEAGNESDSSNITAAPHISFRKTQDNTGSHRPGDTIVYTIQYVNDGFAPSEKLILEDSIPDSITLSDTSEAISGPSVTIEYYNRNTGIWQSSSFPRTAITRIRWIIGQNLDPSASGYDGTIRFRCRIR